MGGKPVVELVFECEKGTRKENSCYFSALRSRKETLFAFPIVNRIF